MKKISQYCQSCRAPNEPGLASCQKCGTPLMIVVNPPGMRHDQFSATSHYEDHLLERISLLEIRLMQLSDSLSLTLKVIGEQSQVIRDEHELVREMYDAIKRLGSEDLRRLKPQWDELVNKHESDKISPRINEIMTAGESKNPEMLELLAREAFEFIGAKDEQRTIAALKRAEPIAPDNVALLLLFAEQLFYADKFDKAKTKLETAFRFAPENEKVRFLLGAVYADEFEIAKAKEMLAFSFDNDRINCAVNVISGMIAAFETDWENSAVFFERSLERFEFAESQYLLAWCLFVLRDHQRSLEHCKKTLNLDSNFTDAYHLKSLNYSYLDQLEEAALATIAVTEHLEIGAQCVETSVANQFEEIENALPFQHFENKKRLLNGGSQRVRNFLRSLVFHILNSQ